jgi:nitrogen fixation protein FixH
MNKMRTEKKPLTGPKVISWFVAFFVVIIAVNGTMTYFAISTFSGVETDDAYRKGRDFNDEIALAEKQKALGWRADVSIEKIDEAKDFFTLTMTDAGGKPLNDLVVSGLFFRPVHKGFDREMPFAFMGDGRYGAVMALPMRGKWHLKFEAASQSGEVFKLTDEVFLEQ